MAPTQRHRSRLSTDLNPQVHQSISKSAHRPAPLFLIVFTLVHCFTHLLPAQTPQPVPDRFTPLSLLPAPGPRFQLLTPTQSGITFQNQLALSQMMTNNNLMNGSGVALGDFDGDGRCDIYLCAISGTNALYRNLGNGTFAEVPHAAGASCVQQSCTGASFADLDGDGDLDLLVGTLGHGVITFKNEEGKRFVDNTAPSGLSPEGGVTSFALGDIDQDGDLDLYVVHYGAQAILRSGASIQAKKVNGELQVIGPYADRLRFVEGRITEVGEPDVLYLNNGQGGFTPVPWNSQAFLDESGNPHPAPWDFGLSAQFRDANGDGFLDLYVCNDFEAPDRFWIGDGKGHFRAVPRLAVRCQSFSSMGVDFADIDRDGFLDYFVVEMLASEHTRRMTQMAGLPPYTPSLGQFEDRPQHIRNTLYHNRGDGTYTELAWFTGTAATDWSWQPVFLDADLDGFEDILITTGHAADVQDRDATAIIRSIGKQSPRQSQTNLALYPTLHTPHVALRNTGNLSFESVGAQWGFHSTEIGHGIALGDLDSDGDQDVVINCLNAPALVYLNQSQEPRIHIALHGIPPNTRAVGSRIRVLSPRFTQTQDIVSGGRYLSSDDGTRTFACPIPEKLSQVEVTWPDGTVSVLTNIPANVRCDLHQHNAAKSQPPSLSPFKPSPPTTEASGSSWFRPSPNSLPHRHHETLFNDYSRQPLLPRQLSQLGPGIACFDLDGDGRDELLIGTGRNGSLALYNVGGRNPTSLEPITSSSDWKAPDDVTGLVPWVRSDGQRFILAALSSYESAPTTAGLIQCSLSHNPTHLHIQPVASLKNFPPAPGPLAVADYNHDGALDLFVGGRTLPGNYPAPASSTLYQQIDGQLVVDDSATTTLSKIGMVTGAIWSDINLDNVPELIVTTEWGPIHILQRHGETWSNVTSSWKLSQHTGFWTGIATGDFNEDGLPDLIAANWGRNTQEQASPEKPLILYFGDMNAQGGLDLIEGYWPEGATAAAPRRTLSALGQAFPMLQERFPTHAAFGKASLQEILGSLPPNPARLHLNLNTLDSMMFINRGQSFEPVPLPREAQWAPAFGVCVSDINRDGHQDVFLSQNFFPMRPELARVDSGLGLWLQGNGKGEWKALQPDESGVRIHGDQRGAALWNADGTGNLHLVVAQNAAATILLDPHPSSMPARALQCSGPKSNPTCIGTAIRWIIDGKPGPRWEIQSGGGYWSSSSQLIPLPHLKSSTPLAVESTTPDGTKRVHPIPSQDQGIITLKLP